LPIEARARALAGDSQSAIDSYRELWRMAPDNPDYGLALVDAQIAAGLAKQALDTVAKLRKLPHPWGDDPRVDLADANANAALGNFAAAHATALTAAQRAAERGAALLVGNARRLDGAVLSRLGRYPEALAAASEAQRLAREAGDKNLEALATNVVGNVYYADLDRPRAKETYQRALAAFRAIGHQASIAGALNNLANTEQALGNYDAAERAYQESLGIARDLRRKRDEIATLNNLGLLMVDRGDLSGAIARHEQTLASYREIGDKSSVISVSLALADELREHGDLPGAHRLATDVLRMGREMDQKFTTMRALIILALLEVDEGDLPGAAAHCQEALALSRAAGSKMRDAGARLTCLRVVIEQGQFEEAARTAQSLAEFYVTEGRPNATSLVYLLSSQAYLGAENLAEARRAFDRVDRVEATRYSIATRWRYATTAARIRAADAPAEAVAALRAVVDEATKSGYLSLAYETRLHLAQAERRANQPDAARAGLERLKKDASGKGFRLVARRATAALGAPSGTREKPKVH
jgi:tetratricopeptide (TPR) repeat protein